MASVAVMIQPTPASFVPLIPEAVAVGMASVANVVTAAGTVAGSVAEAIEAANNDDKKLTRYQFYVSHTTGQRISPGS
jgi:hypothetical protein